MEYFHSFLVLFCGIFVSIYTWKFLNWVWFKPKKIERSLRQQGFKGNSYRLFIGDYTEMVASEKEAQAKPIDFTNHIVPRVMPYINQSISKHGENCFIWLGPTPTAIISDPEMIKEILSKNYVFQKPMHPIAKLLAQGVAAYDTDKWAKHRNLIKPAFHLEKLKNMLPSFYMSCSDMLSKWETIVPSKGSYELDVWPYLQTLSSDAISRTAFGSSYEEGRKIFELQKQQGLLVLEAIQSISFSIPGWRFVPTKLNRRMKQNAKEIESSILQIINKKMRAIELGEGKSDDLLGILLESNFNEIKQNGSQFGITMKEVIDECRLFYIAGQETTSSLLCWTMILLSKHLDWQSRAREEVAQVFGSENPNLQELNHLKVITMIFHEVLRLYPPAVMLSRVIHKETTLGHVTLPAGLQLFLPTILLQHDPKYWGEDAKEFNPERFREGVSKATKEPLSYFPFGGGPRICIGQNFAMLEAKMALAMILQQYSFELSPSYAHAPVMVLTLQSQYGAHIILHKL